MNEKLIKGPGVPDYAARAAMDVYETGGSPRAQIEAARQAAGSRLVYMPHQGMKERLKRLRRMEIAALKTVAR